MDPPPALALPFVLSFLESRRKSSEIVASVARYMDHAIAEAGMETRHLENVRREVERLAKDFAGRSFVDIQDADLLAWFQNRTLRRDKKGNVVMGDAGQPRLLSDKTRNDVRSYMVGLWNWAIVDRIYPAIMTPARRLPRVKDVTRERDILILTPRGFLELAAEIQVKWRGWLALCSMCSMRPEEVSPVQEATKTRKDKRGLYLEEIDWRFKMIRISKEVSKVKKVRNIPLSDTALAWLKWAGIEEGQTGPVCIENPTDAGETKRLGDLLFGGVWPQDILRHSNASYRIVQTFDMGKVAMEMGTSVRMLEQNYNNPRVEEEALEWWSMRPEMIRCDPMRSDETKVWYRNGRVALGGRPLKIRQKRAYVRSRE